MQVFSRTGWLRLACLAALSACGLVAQPLPGHGDESASLKPVPADIEALMIMRGLEPAAPIYLRVFKEESELEVWKARPDGRYVPLKTYPICAWSGALGPKQTQGDQMSPEGFYGFSAGGLNPDSKYHLALNVGYPNSLDRALGRTGNFIMVHGQCVSVGCFAMTDDLIEEIYALAREALAGGAGRIPVHIFPFRMTRANMARHRDNAAYATWAPLKTAYDDFARTREPPRIAYCGGRYIVNPLARIQGTPKDDCPSRIGRLLAPLPPKVLRQIASLDAPLVAEGPKAQRPAESGTWEAFASPAPETTGTARRAAKASLGRIEAANTYDSGALTPLLDRR